MCSMQFVGTFLFVKFVNIKFMFGATIMKLTRLLYRTSIKGDSE